MEGFEGDGGEKWRQQEGGLLGVCQYTCSSACCRGLGMRGGTAWQHFSTLWCTCAPVAHIHN